MYEKRFYNENTCSFDTFTTRVHAHATCKKLDCVVLTKTINGWPSKHRSKYQHGYVLCEQKYSIRSVCITLKQYG